MLVGAGCIICFKVNECAIYINDNHILFTKRCQCTGLWLLPMEWNEPIISISAVQVCMNTVYDVAQYQLSTKSELIKFLHEWVCSPVPPTWIQAVEKGFFLLWSGLTSVEMKKYLPPSPTTTEGHMEAIRKKFSQHIPIGVYPVRLHTYHMHLRISRVHQTTFAKFQIWKSHEWFGVFTSFEKLQIARIALIN